jgi:AraC-like DNA-binding protein
LEKRDRPTSSDPASGDAERPRGLLNPDLGGHVHEAPNLPPSSDLVFCIRSFWAVRWDLRGRDPYHPQVVAYPAVNMVLERGNSRVVGPLRRRFIGRLEGAGQILGITFHPGAFFPFLGRPVADLTDKMIQLGSLFAIDVARLEETVLAPHDDRACIERAESFLRERLPPRDDQADHARAIVERVAADSDLTTVDAVAGAFQINKRALQRLFSRYVGIGPKGVIQIFRLQEAVARLQSDDPPSIADLAAELGYYDQAHFVSAFKAVAGKAPSAYVRSLRR